MSPELSIIIPAYNASKYIEACITSIFSGTYNNMEVLLIDDGSTDGTGELCDRLTERYPAIRLFHTDNRGIAEARNLGIEQAVGQYISFVDSDDLVSPIMFESMVKHMNSDVPLVVCRYLRRQENETMQLNSSVASYETVGQTELMKRLIDDEYGAFAWNKIFRKDIIDAKQIRFPQNCRAIEDMYFTWTYVQQCNKAVFINDALYCYIMHSSSIMNTFRKNRTVDNCYINLPQGWRFCAETVEKFAPELVPLPIARTTMFYQTVLRKLKNPSNDFIEEAIAYVQQNKSVLRHYRWGWKYYLSAIVLSISYPLWSAVFRKGIRSAQICEDHDLS